LINSSSEKNKRLCATRIYPVTDDKYLFGKPHSARVAEIVRGGAGIVQLRDKHAAMGSIYREAETIRKLTIQFNTLFIVNDRVDLARMCDADGVHLGQDDIPVEDARAILGDDAIIGISTHSRSQIETALRSSADYLSFGPVFPTMTKENHEPVQGMSMLGQIVSMVDRPLFAIGGITISRLADVLKQGVTGAAIISDIWAYPDAERRMNEYNQLIARFERNELEL
jgi:thiamine-phosphate pyrophosphorylase